MRIGLVTQAYYPVLGGVTEHVWHVGSELQRRGHRVTVVTGGVPHRLLQPGRPADHDRGLRVARLGFQLPLLTNGANIYVTGGWKIGRRLQQIEARERFDIVHVMSPLDPILPLLASKVMRAPKVGTYHSGREMNGSFAEKIPVWFAPVFRDAIAKIRRHIVVSTTADEFLHHFFPEVPTTVIPNGIDTARFSPSVAPLEKYDTDRLKILYVGRMDPRKGAKFLFGALPRLEQELQGRYQIIVAGTGWLSKYYDAYIPLPLRKRVDFVGYVSPEDLPRYYRSADIYCSPATGNESFGIVLLEAMASGTPIVASDIAGYRSVVEPGREGVLVPSRSSNQIAEAIVALARDPDRRRAMGLAGRRTAERYAWPTVVDRIEAEYRRALGIERD